MVPIGVRTGSTRAKVGPGEFAGAVAILLRSFSDEERASVREATKRATEEFRTGQGYDFPGLSVNALAS